jgi:hypothetical protein
MDIVTLEGEVVLPFDQMALEAMTFELASAYTDWLSVMRTFLGADGFSALLRRIEIGRQAAKLPTDMALDFRTCEYVSQAVFRRFAHIADRSVAKLGLTPVRNDARWTVIRYVQGYVVHSHPQAATPAHVHPHGWLEFESMVGTPIVLDLTHRQFCMCRDYRVPNPPRCVYVGPRTAPYATLYSPTPVCVAYNVHLEYLK